MKISGHIVWVVGASAGIGEEVAYECARKGASVLVLSSRKEKELHRVAKRCADLGTETLVMPLDVTDEEQIESTCDEILTRYGGVDILINNAGVSQRALAFENQFEQDRRIMEINYFGLINIAKRMLGPMIENGRGHIAITSSVTGKFGFPLRSAYAASKHALHGYFESLYLENIKHGIGVTLVCPGRVKTDISRNAVLADGTAHGKMDPGQATGIPAEECARRYIRGIERNKREVYIGKESILIYLRRFVPSLFYRIAQNVNPK